MALWAQSIGAEAITVAEIAKRADSIGTDAISVPRPIVELRDALTEIVHADSWNAKKVGRWLLRHMDRIESGRSFRSNAEESPRRWWLADVECASSPAS